MHSPRGPSTQPSPSGLTPISSAANGGRERRRERRRHVVYITRNTEYHCRDRECVGVRDRRTGCWRREHPALRGELLGALLPKRHAVRPSPGVGLRLVFTRGATVMTTRLLAEARPDREDVFAYTSLCRVGEISSAA